VRVGVSGTHGTGKTTLVDALCTRLPGHVAADEPYFLLEEEGHEFEFPPSLDDFRALYRRSVHILGVPASKIVFDRTPLDYLAYLAAHGADLDREADPSVLRPALASLDLLIATPITPETEQFLPRAEMPRLREKTNDALLELLYSDPLEAWTNVPVIELTCPLDTRLESVLSVLNA
jgi:AAA domain